MLKFISVLVYQATLLCFVAYYKTSRFSNIYLKDLFYLFLVTRPIVVAAYTTFTAVCSIRASYYITKSLRQEKLQLKN